MDENQVAQVVLPVDNIESIVYIIRGRQVMLDTDLALLYGYDVKRLNKQANGNKELRDIQRAEIRSRCGIH